MFSIDSSIQTKLARPLAVVLTLAFATTACGATEADRAVVQVDAAPVVVTTTTVPPAPSTTSSAPSIPVDQVAPEPVVLSPAPADNTDLAFVSPFPFTIADFEDSWNSALVILQPLPLTAIENPPAIPIAPELIRRTWTLEGGPTITVAADRVTGQIWVADITVSMPDLDGDTTLVEAFHRLLGLTQPDDDIMAGARLFGEGLESPGLHRTETMCFSLHGSEVDGGPAASLTIVSVDEPLCGAVS